MEKINSLINNFFKKLADKSSSEGENNIVISDLQFKYEPHPNARASKKTHCRIEGFVSGSIDGKEFKHCTFAHNFADMNLIELESIKDIIPYFIWKIRYAIAGFGGDVNSIDEQNLIKAINEYINKDDSADNYYKANVHDEFKSINMDEYLRENKYERYSDDPEADRMLFKTTLI